jgi:hypothetical protein
MVFGAALVLTMVLRPEGLFPSRARAAELHGEAAVDVTEPMHDEVAAGSTQP